SMTKGEGKSLYISCKVNGLSGSNYVHWYQKKEGEVFTRILYVKSDGKAIQDTNHPDAKEFDVRVQSDQFDLKIPKLKKSHSAVYYCAIWDGATVTGKHSLNIYTKIAVLELMFFLSTEDVLGVKLEQKDLSMTKEEGKSVFISCKVPGLSNNDYVHWYQKKEGEALTRILYVKKIGQAVQDTNHPDGKEFDVRIQSDQFDLKIAKLKKSHSAVYYCASWDS
ncbi:hypothetical protein C0J50_3171, partial [Silurus asotus]